MRLNQINSSDSVGLQRYFMSQSKIFLLSGRALLYSDVFVLQTVCKWPESAFSFLVEMILSVATVFADVSGKTWLARRSPFSDTKNPGKFDSGVKTARLSLGEGKVWKNYEESNRLCPQ